METTDNIEGCDFIFSSEDLNYYKTNRTRTLDEQLGDCYCDILDRENEIMHEVQQFALEIKPTLIALYNFCVELDW